MQPRVISRSTRQQQTVATLPYTTIWTHNAATCWAPCAFLCTHRIFAHHDLLPGHDTASSYFALLCSRIGIDDTPPPKVLAVASGKGGRLAQRQTASLERRQLASSVGLRACTSSRRQNDWTPAMLNQFPPPATAISCDLIVGLSNLGDRPDSSA